MTELPARDALTQLACGEISSVELTRACLDRIALVDGAIGATFAVMERSALVKGGG